MIRQTPEYPSLITDALHSDDSLSRIYGDLGIVSIPVTIDFDQLNLDRVPTQRLAVEPLVVEPQVEAQAEVESAPQTVVDETIYFKANDRTISSRRHRVGMDRFTREERVGARAIIDRVLQESWKEEQLSDEAFEQAFHSDRDRAYTMQGYIEARRPEAGNKPKRGKHRQGTLTVDQAIAKSGLQEDVFDEVQEALDRWHPRELARLSEREQADTISGFVAGLQESMYPTPEDLERHRQAAQNTEPIQIRPMLIQESCDSCYTDMEQDIFPIEGYGRHAAPISPAEVQ